MTLGPNFSGNLLRSCETPQTVADFVQGLVSFSGSSHSPSGGVPDFAEFQPSKREIFHSKENAGSSGGIKNKTIAHCLDLDEIIYFTVTPPQQKFIVHIFSPACFCSHEDRKLEFLLFLIKPLCNILVIQSILVAGVTKVDPGRKRFKTKTRKWEASCPHWTPTTILRSRPG